MCTLRYLSNWYGCYAMSIIVTGCLRPMQQDYISLLTSTRWAKVVKGYYCKWQMCVAYEDVPSMLTAGGCEFNGFKCMYYTIIHGMRNVQASNTRSLRFHMELLVRVIKTTVNINCVNLNGALSLERNEEGGAKSYDQMSLLVYQQVQTPCTINAMVAQVNSYARRSDAKQAC